MSICLAVPGLRAKLQAQDSWLKVAEQSQVCPSAAGKVRSPFHYHIPLSWVAYCVKRVSAQPFFLKNILLAASFMVFVYLFYNCHKYDHPRPVTYSIFCAQAI